MQIKGQQALHVNYFGFDAQPLKLFCGFQHDPAAGAIGDQGDVGAGAQHFRQAQWRGKFADIIRQAFFQAIAVQHFDHQRRFIAAQQGVVKAGGLGGVAGR